MLAEAIADLRPGLEIEDTLVVPVPTFQQITFTRIQSIRIDCRISAQNYAGTAGDETLVAVDPAYPADGDHKRD